MQMYTTQAVRNAAVKELPANLLERREGRATREGATIVRSCHHHRHRSSLYLQRPRVPAVTSQPQCFRTGGCHRTIVYTNDKPVRENAHGWYLSNCTWLNSCSTPSLSVVAPPSSAAGAAPFARPPRQAVSLLPQTNFVSPRLSPSCGNCC